MGTQGKKFATARLLSSWGQPRWIGFSHAMLLSTWVGLWGVLWSDPENLSEMYSLEVLFFLSVSWDSLENPLWTEWGNLDFANSAPHLQLLGWWSLSLRARLKNWGWLGQQPSLCVLQSLKRTARAQHRLCWMQILVKGYGTSVILGELLCLCFSLKKFSCVVWAFPQWNLQTCLLALQGSSALVANGVCSLGIENEEKFQEVLSEHLHSASDTYHKEEIFPSFLGLALALPGKAQSSQKDRLPLWQNHHWNYPALS